MDEAVVWMSTRPNEANSGSMLLQLRYIYMHVHVMFPNIKRLIS